jgi:hypothetical protein
LHFQDRGSLDPTTNKGNSAELPLPSSSCCLSLHALLPITQPVAPQLSSAAAEQGCDSHRNALAEQLCDPVAGETGLALSHKGSAASLNR